MKKKSNIPAHNIPAMDFFAKGDFVRIPARFYAKGPNSGEFGYENGKVRWAARRQCAVRLARAGGSAVKRGGARISQECRYEHP